MPITAIPVIRNVIDSGDTILNLIAGVPIAAGQAVEAASTGVSGEVIPGIGGKAPLGVAMYGAEAGAPIAIVSVGCVATVASEEAIDAGELVNVVAAVGGTPAGGLVGVASGTEYVLGVAIDNIAVDGTGRVLIAPSQAGGS